MREAYLLTGVPGSYGRRWTRMTVTGTSPRPRAGRLMNDRGSSGRWRTASLLIKDVLGGDPSETDSAGKPRGGCRVLASCSTPTPGF